MIQITLLKNKDRQLTKDIKGNINIINLIQKFNSIELFAGAGGLAIGLERAGFNAIGLNEFDKDACKTLRTNRPNWNVIEGDVKNVDFTEFSNVDLFAGGFPCQAFSYAGNKLGF